jgi:hypothetical protein
LGERAHLMACERHNAATIRPAFWKALTDATQGSAQTRREEGGLFDRDNGRYA